MLIVVMRNQKLSIFYEIFNAETSILRPYVLLTFDYLMMLIAFECCQNFRRGFSLYHGVMDMACDVLLSLSYFWWIGRTFLYSSVMKDVKMEKKT